jgi:hypothetical protein
MIMHNRILITLMLLLPATLFAQATVVEDRANVGQLKRMVYEQWDDWQPSPETNWLGFPVNLAGFIYWRILHNAYYTGEDLRPWRADGPFMQDYGSLALQEQHDQQIADSMEAVLRTQMSTHVQMSGGELDIAYRIFFGPKFSALFDQMDTDIASFAGLYPDVFSTISATKSFRDFLEMLDITQDDISQVHAAYMDKGKRIEAYLGILHQLEKRQLWLNKYLGQYALLSRFPTHDQAERTRKQIQKSYSPNDARIVREILEKF